MTRDLRRLAAALASALAATGCSSDFGITPQRGLSLGQSNSGSGAQTVRLEGGSTGADYYAILVNTSGTDGASEQYTVQTTGAIAPTTMLAPIGDSRLTRLATPDGDVDAAPSLDQALETRVRSRERRELTPRIAGARAWMASRTPGSSTISGANETRSFDVARRDAALPSGVKVGDLVTVNVNGNDPCSNPVYHAARVTAIGTHAIVLADTLNPLGGFTTADFQRFAARFDTLVYPLDSAAFGPPTDIDGNGHVGLVFTRAVNELTPANVSWYFGGFTFVRDLFPIAGSASFQGCPGSNEGEYFYLLTPDPSGTINGNVRTAGFVDTSTTAVIAHEFQHLINASRRMYVNNAMVFEETWLDEGLAHVAEELLFYREAGLRPKSNIDTPQIRASSQRMTAFNLDMVGNSDRYHTYLKAPARSSPYAAYDSLSTRGAAWSLLRYLADRSGRSDNAFFFALANGTTSGLANLKTVYGADVAGAVRDWSASHAVDELVSTTPELQQPSWNWHSVHATIYGSYPLAVQVLADGAASSGSVVPGGAAYYRLAVPAGTSATLSLAAPSATAGTNLQLVVVRTR
ncbi:MAG TPA: hypothetical protein VFI52_09970 [Gemmatimonadaceae bacterium]|nr:hypothetical protein [Gemmatimonadaceae bacterium]